MNKNFYVEKPLSISLLDLNKINNKIIKKNIKFIVGFNRRYSEYIKSIKKAARKVLYEVLTKRVDLIIEERKISLENDNKIYWRNSPIAKIIKGSDYLSPEIEVISYDSLDKNSRDNLTKFLKDWLSKYKIESLKVENYFFLK